MSEKEKDLAARCAAAMNTATTYEVLPQDREDARWLDAPAFTPRSRAMIERVILESLGLR